MMAQSSLHLAIDIRNRIATIGLYDHSRWLAIRRIGVHPGRTPDEYAYFLRAMMGTMMGTNMGTIMGTIMGTELAEEESNRKRASLSLQTAWISSVVPHATDAFIEAVRQEFGIEAGLIGPGVKTGLKIRTDTPGEVGADLVCAAVAAKQLCSVPCIIIDFGVAITLSALNRAGEFVGAAIAPGLEASVEALKANAAQLPEVKLAFPARAIGASTADAIRSGVVLGAAGAVESLISRFSIELHSSSVPLPSGGTNLQERSASPTIVGTGDSLGKEILARLGHTTFEPNLVLDGIRIIASMNSHR